MCSGQRHTTIKWFWVVFKCNNREHLLLRYLAVLWIHLLHVEVYGTLWVLPVFHQIPVELVDVLSHNARLQHNDTHRAISPKVFWPLASLSWKKSVRRRTLVVNNFSRSWSVPLSRYVAVSFHVGVANINGDTYKRRGGGKARWSPQIGDKEESIDLHRSHCKHIWHRQRSVCPYLHHNPAHNVT